MRNRTLLAEITDINFNKTTQAFAEYLLRYVRVPIDVEYGKKLEDAGICEVQFYEQEYDDMGIPTNKILIGKLI